MANGDGESVLPQRAVVAPRARLAGGEPLPVEYFVGRMLEQRSKAAVCLTGPPGSGKTVALQHLAAVFGDALLVQEGMPHARLAEKLLVFASRAHPGVPVVLEMAEWGRDEIIEYLLHAHPAECRSVMQRLETHGLELPGNAALCVAVLEEMVAHPELADIPTALRLAARRETATPERYEEAMTSCAAAMLRPGTWYGLQDFPERTLQHRATAEAVAAEKLARDIAALRLGSLKEPWTNRLLVLTAEMMRTLNRDIDAIEHAIHCVPSYHADGASLLALMDPTWRPRHGKFVEMRGATLRGVRWDDIDLADCWLEDCAFSGADLTRAVMHAVQAAGALFRRTTLMRACLQGARLQGAVLAHADLSMAELTAALLPKANLEGADLHGANLRMCDLDGADLKGAKLVGAFLEKASLARTCVDRADFSAADFTDARLVGVALWRARVQDAVFRNTRLLECDLGGLHMTRPDFEGADLSSSDLTATAFPGANLREANLQGTSLADVDWEGADLRGADFTDATFHMGSSRSGMVGSVIASEGSRIGFYTDDREEQYYKAPEEIRKANLCRCDLRGAIVHGTDWYLVDLRNALYTPDQEDHFLKCGAILRR